jgi:hypothetical protein
MYACGFGVSGWKELKQTHPTTPYLHILAEDRGVR